MILTREEILSAPNAKDIPLVYVPCPEWKEGGEIALRIMSGTERDAWDDRQSKLNKRPEGFVRAGLVAMLAVNEDRSPMFKPEDIELLSEKSTIPLDRLFIRCLEINGMLKSSIDEREKNLESGQSENSGTDLHLPQVDVL